MGRSSIGQAKNVARRALRAIVDVEPRAKEVSRVWEFFDSTCAYCGLKMIRSDRKGHLDHLVRNGVNHISNRVLSCGKCNGDEKRERDWLEFLKSKVPDIQEFQKRKNRIEKWVEENSSKNCSGGCPAILDEEIKKLMGAFDQSASRLRAFRDSKRAA